MSQDHTPNVLSRETTFLMGILKPCFMGKKVDSRELEEITLKEDCSAQKFVSCSDGNHSKKNNAVPKKMEQVIKTLNSTQRTWSIYPESLEK